VLLAHLKLMSSPLPLPWGKVPGAEAADNGVDIDLLSTMGLAPGSRIEVDWEVEIQGEEGDVEEVKIKVRGTHTRSLTALETNIPDR
jgi:hypothetical protein